MALKTWRNHEDADVVRKIIEYNFRVLGRYLSRNIMALSTSERNSLTSEYLSNGLIVFDTTLGKWLQYNGGVWDEYNVGEYYKVISQLDWRNGIIYIPYSEHKVSSPIVQVFVLNNGSYELAVGGVNVDENHNVTISSDMQFNGKVVIK